MDSTHWVAVLPIVLLGICTSLKQDIGCCAAELVNGSTLRLPGKFFPSSKDAHPDPVTYTSQLKNYMQQLQPSPVSVKHIKQSFVHNNLSTCTHVFIRHDAVEKLLQQLYDGPFKVLKRSGKHFTLEVKGKDSIVSIDRLKPAFLDQQVDDTLMTPQS